MDKESEYDEKHVQLYVGKIAFDPHRLIYATIILMVALAVYNQEAESWSGTPFMDLVVVVFAPLLALSSRTRFRMRSTCRSAPVSVYRPRSADTSWASPCSTSRWAYPSLPSGLCG